jgi:staphylococcal nuclease domain-containing protein 1
VSYVSWLLEIRQLTLPWQPQDREFASLLIAPAGPGQPPQDVATLVIAAGWAKVRDGVGEGDEAVR